MDPPESMMSRRVGQRSGQTASRRVHQGSGQTPSGSGYAGPSSSQASTSQPIHASTQGQQILHTGDIHSVVGTEYTVGYGSGRSPTAAVRDEGHTYIPNPTSQPWNYINNLTLEHQQAYRYYNTSTTSNRDEFLQATSNHLQTGPQPNLEPYTFQLSATPDAYTAAPRLTPAPEVETPSSEGFLDMAQNHDLRTMGGMFSWHHSADADPTQFQNFGSGSSFQVQPAENLKRRRKSVPTTTATILEVVDYVRKGGGQYLDPVLIMELRRRLLNEDMCIQSGIIPRSRLHLSHEERINVIDALRSGVGIDAIPEETFLKIIFWLEFWTQFYIDRDPSLQLAGQMPANDPYKNNAACVRKYDLLDDYIIQFLNENNWTWNSDRMPRGEDLARLAVIQKKISEYRRDFGLGCNCTGHVHINIDSPDYNPLFYTGCAVYQLTVLFLEDLGFARPCLLVAVETENRPCIITTTMCLLQGALHTQLLLRSVTRDIFVQIDNETLKSGPLWMSTILRGQVRLRHDFLAVIQIEEIATERVWIYAFWIFVRNAIVKRDSECIRKIKAENPEFIPFIRTIAEAERNKAAPRPRNLWPSSNIKAWIT